MNRISIKNTNNPSIVKFEWDEMLTKGKNFEFKNIDETSESPLAKQLFYLPFVKTVYISGNFIAIEKFSIVDANTLWSFPYDGTGSTTTNYKQISTTTNGGTTWNYKAITFGLSTSHISDICAVSATQAWLACYGASGVSGNGVYVTSDGGTTWTKQTTAPFNVATSFPNVVHLDRKSTRLNSSHLKLSRMPSSA